MIKSLKIFVIKITFAMMHFHMIKNDFFTAQMLFEKEPVIYLGHN